MTGGPRSGPTADGGGLRPRPGQTRDPLEKRSCGLYTWIMGEYKFQSLLVYQLSIEYIDQVYKLTKQLPADERFNLSSQLIRAATSIALNVAEGSSGQTDKEQARFLGLAIRSNIETVACLDLIERRAYIPSQELLCAKTSGRTLFTKLTKFQKALRV